MSCRAQLETSGESIFLFLRAAQGLGSELLSMSLLVIESSVTTEARSPDRAPSLWKLAFPWQLVPRVIASIKQRQKDNVSHYKHLSHGAPLFYVFCHEVPQQIPHKSNRAAQA